MVLRFKRIHPDAVLPAYAHEGDAGLDLYSVETIEIPPSESRRIRTGLVMELPPGTEAQVRPRSGLALRHQITVLNGPGTIDAGYRGEICVLLINHGKASFCVTAGMKMAQMVIQRVLTVQVVEAEKLSDTGRGTGGFGSTGTC